MLISPKRLKVRTSNLAGVFPGIVPTWLLQKFPMWEWPGSRDHDNCTVQTAAMGQIPRSTERILVINVIPCYYGQRFDADSHHKKDQICWTCSAEGIVGKSCTDGQSGRTRARDHQRLTFLLGGWEEQSLVVFSHFISRVKHRPIEEIQTSWLLPITSGCWLDSLIDWLIDWLYKISTLVNDNV